MYVWVCVCVCVCMYWFYGAYEPGLVSQVSKSITVSVNASYSRLMDLRAEESRVLRQVKPPRCEEASRKPRALAGIEPKPLVT